MSRSQPLNVSTLLKEAIGLHQQGKLQAAQVLYRQVLELSPDEFDALHLLGVIARQLGQAELAVSLISHAISINPAQAGARCNLGAALQDLGLTAESLASYEVAVRLDPHYALAFSNRGNALRNLGRTQEALASYDRALAIRPLYPEASCNRAIVLQDLGQSAASLISADQAILGRANYADALCARANALQSLDRLDEAITSYDRAIDANAGSAEAYCWRGTALKKRNDHDAALQSYDQAIALRHTYPEAHQFRGNLLRALGRTEDAIAAYRMALSLGGNSSQLSFALAALGAGDAPAAAPATYVKELFDQYAGHFDQHLLEVLDYRTPAILDNIIRKWLAVPRHVNQQKNENTENKTRIDTLDLGCGTGLCGPYLRPYSRTLTGVDLSEKMLAQAHQGQLYDQLECADIGDFLAGQTKQFDLVVAADVFVYFGDLAPVFAQMQQCLRPNGYACFSVEACDEGDFTLQASNRYAHSHPYLQRLASNAGFILLESERGPLRSENGAQIMGYAVLLRSLR